MDSGTINFDTAGGAASALGWLAAAGVDVIVDERPRNWLAEPKARPTPVLQTPAATPAPAHPPQRPAKAAAGAAAAAGQAANLGTLLATLTDFNHPLRAAAPPQLLTGADDSGVLVLLDQPLTADAAAQQLLERMLGAIGLDHSSCATGHILPWATPAGRAPRDEEIAAFSPFMARAMALASPRFILALGDRAASFGAQASADNRRGIASMRGKWLAINNVPMIATFHPRQLLAQPELKRLAWADLQAFSKGLSA